MEPLHVSMGTVKIRAFQLLESIGVPGPVSGLDVPLFVLSSSAQLGPMKGAKHFLVVLLQARPQAHVTPGQEVQGWQSPAGLGTQTPLQSAKPAVSMRAV